MRGATMYGLSMNVISSRVLKYTYGVKARERWTEGNPIERKTDDGRIDKFSCIVEREYCDEPGVDLLGQITINLTGLGLDELKFGLNFGRTEITATAKNKTNGKMMETIFEYFK
ncbi:unnamed protein product [Rhizophagus irregularis]|nr:unnamed protein product [Rhizophagus irregularis]